MATGVLPVFLKAKDVPDSSSNRPAVLEMCLAAEKSAGQGSIVGAQQINGLWRIYPSSSDARNQLLIQGMRVRGVVLQVAGTNPFVLRSDSGEEKPSTKVWIDNVPISVADSEFEHSLVSIGCELRSSIKAERARDSDGKLTRFLTGRRFVYITVPSAPLGKFLKISLFNAKIFHKEQPQVPRKPVVCSKCLKENHHASVCQNEIVCHACKQSGHKRGDSVCHFSCDEVAPADDREVSSDEETTSDQPDDNRPRPEPQPRGRTGGRQAKLSSSLQLEGLPRHRSETPGKRHRSKSSPREVTGKNKQAKRDNARSKHQASPVSASKGGIDDKAGGKSG